MIIHQAASSPGIVMKCSLLGALSVEQTEKGETFHNDRYLLCPQKQDAEDGPATDGIPEELRRQIKQFLQASVLGSDKKLKFVGWQSAKQALKGIKKGQKAFKRKKKSDAPA